MIQEQSHDEDRDRPVTSSPQPYRSFIRINFGFSRTQCATHPACPLHRVYEALLRGVQPPGLLREGHPHARHHLSDVVTLAEQDNLLDEIWVGPATLDLQAHHDFVHPLRIVRLRELHP